jgi:hypothetical protein
MHASWRLVLLACGVFLLAGCGRAMTTGIGSANPSATATNVAAPPDSTPPGTVSATNSSGIVISLDHATYASDAGIHVSVKNGLATAIYTTDTHASCSIFTLQVQVNGAWQGSNAAPCPLGRIAAPVRIAADATYTATIHAGEIKSGTFPAGVYRLALAYSTSPDAVPGIDGGAVAYSPTFQVQG